MKKMKVLTLVLALALVLACVIGGTIAWLTAKSDVVTNTFTTSNIKVTLTETTGTEYKMVPGYTLTKDPAATVVAGSEECWLFVRLEKSANFDNYLTFEIADGWTLVEGQTNVYARRVESSDIGTSYSVLKNNQVVVKGDVTQAMMEAAEGNLPTLSITAYASQLHKTADAEFTAAEAWANVPLN